MKILISGTTGVGKSTTSHKLASKLNSLGLNAKVIGEEIVKSPLFKLYFESISEWGFLAQLDFLLIRFKQWFDVEKKLEKDKNQIFIFDRHFLDDFIFSNLKSIEMSLSSFQRYDYRNLYNQLSKKLLDYQKMDYVFMLNASFDTILRRMKKRGRVEEKSFPLDYWIDLYKLYYEKKKYRDKFIQSSKKFININTERKKPNEIVDLIVKKLKLVRNENSN